MFFEIPIDPLVQYEYGKNPSQIINYIARIGAI